MSPVPALETYDGYPADAYTQEASYYQDYSSRGRDMAYPPPQQVSAMSYPPPPGARSAHQEELYGTEQHHPDQSYSSMDLHKPTNEGQPQAMTAARDGRRQSVIVLTGPHLNRGTNDWTYGICGCFNNCGICILSFVCPCYIIGKNAEYLGESFIIYGIASCIMPLFVQFFVRQKIRERLQIKGSEVEDCCLICLLQPLALTQDHLELLDASYRGEVTGVTIQRQ